MSRAGPDYYAVLGVPREATAEEIRRAYRGIARRIHPDVSVLGVSEPMAAANAAWRVLGDEVRRAAYDQEIAFSAARDPAIIVAEPPVAGAPVPQRARLLVLVAALMCAVIFVLIVLIGFIQGPGGTP